MKTLNFQRTFLFCPPFVPMDAFEQVKNSVNSMKKFTNAVVVVSSNDKGPLMVNFVHDLQVYNNTPVLTVGLSSKRNVKYKVKMVCNQTQTPKILAPRQQSVIGNCPASNNGCCCHVMALIWKLESMTRKSELKNITPDDRCCTSKPREWAKRE